VAALLSDVGIVDGGLVVVSLVSTPVVLIPVETPVAPVDAGPFIPDVTIEVVSVAPAVDPGAGCGVVVGPSSVAGMPVPVVDMRIAVGDAPDCVGLTRVAFNNGGVASTWVGLGFAVDKRVVPSVSAAVEARPVENTIDVPTRVGRLGVRVVGMIALPVPDAPGRDPLIFSDKTSEVGMIGRILGRVDGLTALLVPEAPGKDTPLLNENTPELGIVGEAIGKIVRSVVVPVPDAPGRDTPSVSDSRPEVGMAGDIVGKPVGLVVMLVLDAPGRDTPSDTDKTPEVGMANEAVGEFVGLVVMPVPDAPGRDSPSDIDKMSEVSIVGTIVGNIVSDTGMPAETLSVRSVPEVGIIDRPVVANGDFPTVGDACSTPVDGPPLVFVSDVEIEPDPIVGARSIPLVRVVVIGLVGVIGACWSVLAVVEISRSVVGSRVGPIGDSDAKSEPVGVVPSTLSVCSSVGNATIGGVVFGELVIVPGFPVGVPAVIGEVSILVVVPLPVVTFPVGLKVSLILPVSTVEPFSGLLPELGVVLVLVIKTPSVSVVGVTGGVMIVDILSVGLSEPEIGVVAIVVGFAG
jgi:hypothetical protein